MENKSKNSLNHQQKTTNLWQEILREAMPKTETDNTNLFVFGDSMTGKRLLFKGMNRAIFENSQDSDDKKRENQRIEEIAKFSLVDYTFLNIQEFPHDKDAEIIGKLNVWIMNFFIDKEKIMEIIKPNDLLNSICLIVTDLSRPWMVKESLIKWTNLIQETFDELIKKLPENFRFIADAYSAYPLAAQQFFREYGKAFKFEITQVLGLTNDDAVSKEFRPYKQLIERLNRTYKASYRPTNGFDNYDGANYDLSLWVAYYNFLRPHQALHNRPPVEDDMIRSGGNMPGKWQLMIFLGQQTILKMQNQNIA